MQATHSEPHTRKAGSKHRPRACSSGRCEEAGLAAAAGRGGARPSKRGQPARPLQGSRRRLPAASARALGMKQRQARRRRTTNQNCRCGSARHTRSARGTGQASGARPAHCAWVAVQRGEPSGNQRAGDVRAIESSLPPHAKGQPGCCLPACLPMVRGLAVLLPQCQPARGGQQQPRRPCGSQAPPPLLPALRW